MGKLEQERKQEPLALAAAATTSPHLQLRHDARGMDGEVHLRLRRHHGLAGARLGCHSKRRLQESRCEAVPPRCRTPAVPPYRCRQRRAATCSCGAARLLRVLSIGGAALQGPAIAPMLALTSRTVRRMPQREKTLCPSGHAKQAGNSFRRGHSCVHLTNFHAYDHSKTSFGSRTLMRVAQSFRPPLALPLRASVRATRAVTVMSAAPKYDIAVKAADGKLGDCEWVRGRVAAAAAAGGAT